MGINTKAMMRGLGQGLAQYGQQIGANAQAEKQQMLSEKSQQMRDQRMQQYRQQDQQIAAQRHDQVMGQQQDFQREVMGFKKDQALEMAEAKAVSDSIGRQESLEDKLTVEAFKAKNNPSGTNVTTNIGEEKLSPQDKKVAEGRGDVNVETIKKLTKEYEDIPMMRSRINTIKDILAENTSGKTSDLYAAAGKYFGTSMGDAKTKIDALVAPIVLSLKDEMPGPLSDADRMFLVSASVGFDKSPEANATLIRLLEQKLAFQENAYNSMNSHFQAGNTNLNNWQYPTEIPDVGGKSGGIGGGSGPIDSGWGKPNMAPPGQPAPQVPTAETAVPMGQPVNPMADAFDQFEIQKYGGQ